jgi:hypothetical protein
MQGHRLKSAGGNNTMAALLQLKCPRRLILTGTPVQNNLKEYALSSRLRIAAACFRLLADELCARCHMHAAARLLPCQA